MSSEYVSDQLSFPFFHVHFGLSSILWVQYVSLCIWRGLFSLQQHPLPFSLAISMLAQKAHLVKDMVECVLVVENTPSKDKTLVGSRNDGGFCVQSSDNQFLELVYRCLSTDHDRKPVGGMARRGDVYDEGLCCMNLFHDGRWFVWRCCCVPFVRNCICRLVSVWCDRVKGKGAGGRSKREGGLWIGFQVRIRDGKNRKGQKRVTKGAENSLPRLVASEKRYDRWSPERDGADKDVWRGDEAKRGDATMSSALYFFFFSLRVGAKKRRGLSNGTFE